MSFQSLHYSYHQKIKLIIFVSYQMGVNLLKLIFRFRDAILECNYEDGNIEQ